jgi:hypothetical protein
MAAARRTDSALESERIDEVDPSADGGARSGPPGVDGTALEMETREASASMSSERPTLRIAIRRSGSMRSMPMPVLLDAIELHVSSSVGAGAGDGSTGEAGGGGLEAGGGVVGAGAGTRESGRPVTRGADGGSAPAGSVSGGRYLVLVEARETVLAEAFPLAAVVAVEGPYTATLGFMYISSEWSLEVLVRDGAYRLNRVVWRLAVEEADVSVMLFLDGVGLVVSCGARGVSVLCRETLMAAIATPATASASSPRTVLVSLPTLIFPSLKLRPCPATRPIRCWVRASCAASISWSGPSPCPCGAVLGAVRS